MKEKTMKVVELLGQLSQVSEKQLKLPVFAWRDHEIFPIQLVDSSHDRIEINIGESLDGATSRHGGQLFMLISNILNLLSPEDGPIQADGFKNPYVIQAIITLRKFKGKSAVEPTRIEHFYQKYCVKPVAEQFARDLEKDLGLAKMDIIRRRNYKYKLQGEENVCASHEFTDANLYMADAISTILGDECDPETEDHRILWCEAWNMATNKYLMAEEL